MASSSSSLFASLLLFFILFVSTPKTHAMKEKKTRLQFYYREHLAGPAATVLVAGQNLTSTGFGNVLVADAELREGSDPDSQLVGRVQGIATRSSLDGLGYIVALEFVFTAGRYNRSTLAVIGHLQTPLKTREWSVVGGTGKFRLARGYVHGETVSVDAALVVVDYKLYVMHY